MALSDYTPVLAWFADSLSDLDVPTGSTPTTPTGLSAPTLAGSPDSYAEFGGAHGVSFAPPAAVNNVGTGDITIVFKGRLDTSGSNRTIVENYDGSGSNDTDAGWAIENHSGTSRRVGLYFPPRIAATEVLSNSSNSLSLGQDYIIAFRRQSGTWTVWLDADASGGMVADTPEEDTIDHETNLSSCGFITFGAVRNAGNGELDGRIYWLVSFDEAISDEDLQLADWTDEANLKAAWFAAEPVDAEAAIAVPSAQLSATVQIGRSVSAALTLPAALLSAASSVSRSASGALDVPAVELEAAAGIVTLCEGTLGIPAAQIASTASIERSASAALTVPSTTLDATSSAGRTASAAIVVTVPAVAATATTLRTVSAAIETPSAELSATAARTVAAAADIQTPAVGLQASASIVRLASGDLAIAVPVVDATAAGEELTVSASLAIPAVEVEASALISRTAQGTLTVPAVELSSDVEREVTAEGLLILTAPTVEAQAAIERLVQADIELPEAIVAAQTFSGAIQSVIGLRASVRKLGTLSATVTPIGKKATLQ